MFVKLVYFLLRFVLRYRESVVKKNLIFMFPRLSHAQEKKIIHAYYRFFSKSSWETIRVCFWLYARRSNLDKLKILEISNVSLIEKYRLLEQSIIIIASHYASWGSVLQTFPLSVSVPVISAFKPLKNNFFEKFIARYRRACGNIIISSNKINRSILKTKKRAVCYLFLTDQYPSSNSRSVEVSFFNRKVRFFSGPAAIARKLNCPVFYLSITGDTDNRVSAELIELTNQAEELEEEDITQKAVSELERQIKQDPALWLLSHKRFKDLVDYDVRTKST